MWPEYYKLSQTTEADMSDTELEEQTSCNAAGADACVMCAALLP